MRAVPLSALPSAQRHQQENFPVASWLCPPALRPPILAIYRFARYADDLADEGNTSVAERQQAIAELRSQLRAIKEGQPCEPALRPVLDPLAQALRDHQLPLPLLEALLDAFHQDTWVQRYANRAELLHYCERSANPVGRLLLHLFGIQDAAALRASDAICTALQLINFWQDLSLDRLKGRVYLPADRLAAAGSSVGQVLDGHDSPSLRLCVAGELDWACALMCEGASLPFRVPGRMGWELRLVVQGGLRVAEKIRTMNHATLLHRPRLRAWDAPLLLWRAARMDPRA
ncbi:squalene synthase HpnC [Inhella proteolytica]|uniref:Squalene synthase HpnC n=1 Tax=Inhella proteolytica TaxID=2795029 RepID=A0A931NI80_9BURK|nr:squalene synthase HpnC [Inhella proteolytica]MBH9577819.1 squalene synthase HpnC [Inhella proteolytica]